MTRRFPPTVIVPAFTAMFRVVLEFVISALMSTSPPTVSDAVLSAKVRVMALVLEFEPTIRDAAWAEYPDPIVTVTAASIVTASAEVGT